MKSYLKFKCWRFKLFWLINALPLLFFVGCEGVNVINSTTRKCSENDLNRTYDWLTIMPYQDDMGWEVRLQDKSFNSWQQWIDQGKAIPKIEMCLIVVLEKENNVVIRSRTASAVGFVGTEAAIPYLLELLKNDVPLVQMEAAASLGRLGGTEVIAPLCEALSNQDPNVRANVCTALGQLGSKEAESCLMEAIDDESGFVRSAASAALHNLNFQNKTD